MSDTHTPFFGSRAARKAFEAKKIFDLADDAGRELTADERARVEDLLGSAKADHEIEQRMSELGRSFGAPELVPESPHALASLTPGERFTRSEGFRRIKSLDGRGEQWTSGLVDVGAVPLSAKGTLLEAPGGGGGAFVSTPYVVPGVVDRLFQPLTIEGLLSSGQTPSPSVRYLTVGTATSGAAGVAEGGTKPESTIGLTTADEPIKKIATVVPV